MTDTATLEPLKPGTVPTWHPMRDFFSELLDGAEAEYQAKLTGTLLGPRTGLTKLDRELSGRLSPGYQVLQGNTGSGKTGLALQIAGECGFPALVVSCEMDPLELIKRTIARTTGTFLHDLKDGTFTRNAYAEKAAAAVKACPQLAFMDATLSYAHPDVIREAAEIWRGEAAHVLVILDSLHAWTRGAPDFSERGEYESLGSSVLEIQRIARELDAPVLVVAELNRYGAESGGVNASAGSHTIESGAHVVFGLYRDSLKIEGASRPKPFDKDGDADAHITLEKNRHGPTGRIELKYCGRLQRFREV